jgi:hypothetical protein
MASMNMINFYAIHDAWFKNLLDGDVDDRAAIKFYEKIINQMPNMVIYVFLTDSRYEISKEYYTKSNITFVENFNIEDVKRATHVGVFANIKDSSIRDQITEVILEKKNGCCQGNVIGTYNFPNDSYAGLLNAMTYKFPTDFTNISFPSKLLDVLDPEYKEDYLLYGMFKLIAIGGIAHMPALIYRLYCPRIGGGPGTNILKIQEWFKETYDFIPKDMTIDETNFIEVNNMILENFTPPEFVPLNTLMEKTRELKQIKIVDKKYQEGFYMSDINYDALDNSLKVMMIFGNNIYKPKDSETLFNSDVKQFYSLTNLPEGMLKCKFNETPPLYDLVAAFCIFVNVFNMSSPAFHTQDNKEFVKELIIEFFNE